MPVKTGHATITVRQRGVHQDAGAECGEEGLREGTMRKLATASIAYLLAACAQSPPTADPPKEQPQVGRYVIVHSPQIERDTVLLDTATGKTWEAVTFTDLEDGPTAWRPMARTDDEDEMNELRSDHPPKGMKTK